MLSVPHRTPEQRAAALASAQRVRQVQAQVKQMLKTGELGCSEVLGRIDEADAIARLRVVDLLQSLPRVGPVGARRAMERLGIAPSRRLAGLGPRQLQALRDEFGPG